VAYIGTQPVRGQYRKLSDISSGFNGSTTTFTTSVPPGTSSYYVTAGSASQLLVSLGGVIQQPDVDYTVGIYSITFTTAPAAGLSFFGVLMGDSLNSGSPADGSVTTSKLAGNLSLGLAGGSASTPSLFFTGDANTGVYSPGADTLAFVEGGVEAMRIDSSGRVGIGTNSPGTELHISRATAGRVITRLADPDGRTTELRSPDNVGNTAGVGTTTNHPFVFFQNNTEAVRVDESKRLLVGTSTATANGGVLELSGGITFPATAVAASNANTLDDYEEGTWTPTQGGGLTVVGTFTSAGHYIKVGRQVTVQGYVSGSTSVAATANTVFCGGLPFLVMNVTGSNFIGGASNANLTALINVWANQVTTTLYAVTSMAATGGIYFTVSYFTA